MIVVLVLMAAVLAGRWVGRAVRGLVRFIGRRRRRTAELRALPAVVGPGLTREEAECLLAAALLAGLVAREEYRESLTCLARADDVRSPLSVPSLRRE
ncbi:hypothetical protein [Kitasatospora sp. GAS204B]|uniref:hypothetical protein n=1 Tax=unclassified Kitasatospora TaxID=2633591 RepID=UPI00247536EA|nr:hypothetical protein [Kitasatospora sp. GAS204B]MDH6117676.1 hypothetical protein [Kitasatospora sp. GAS204B]